MAAHIKTRPNRTMPVSMTKHPPEVKSQVFSIPLTYFRAHPESESWPVSSDRAIEAFMVMPVYLIARSLLVFLMACGYSVFLEPNLRNRRVVVEGRGVLSLRFGID